MVEKRKLAVFPEKKEGINGLLFFPQQFEEFYQDHFGLRDNFIRMYNIVDFRLFNTAPVPYVLKGNDGWFFYTAEHVIEDYYGQVQADSIKLDKYMSMFADRQAWLAKKGIRYLFIPVPNKITVYDEYLPHRIRHSRGISFYEQFLTATQHKDARFKNIADLSAIFQKRRKQTQLYCRTDTHWSEEGALVAFNRALDICRQWFPGELPELSTDEFLRSTVPFSGDLAIMMNLQKEVSEQVDIMTMKQPCAGADQHLSAREMAILSKSNKNPEQFSTNGCPQRKLTALVIHDSFGINLRRYFNERFKRVTYSPNQLDKLQDFILQEKPDIVFEVWVGRNMPKINPIPEMTAEVLADQYAASGLERLQISGTREMPEIIFQHDLTLKRSPEGLQITSSSDDPFFIIPFTPPIHGERYIAEVIIDAPQETSFVLFFTTGDDSDNIKPQQKVVLHMHKGGNRLLFRLPHPDIWGQLRIDPGVTTGNYLLRSLTIKAVQER